MKQHFFVENRKKLVKQLEEGTVTVLFSGEAPAKSADETYEFVPNRNFYYLTGITVPKVTLMIKKNGTVEETLFIEEVDPMMEKWVGKMITKEEVKETSGVEHVVYLDTFTASLHRELQGENFGKVCLDIERMGWDAPLTSVHHFTQMLLEKYPHVAITNVHPDICKLRTTKSEAEVENIRHAINTTREGIENIMTHAKPGMMEYELEAYFGYTLHSHGTSHAFPTIAGAGANGTVLHYRANNAQARDGHLVLFDLGAAHQYYGADITRTLPVNGKFSERQKQIYDIVLQALTETTKMIKPGIHMADLQTNTKRILADGCRKLGLIDYDEELFNYYWYSVSHFLGLDTHDVGQKKEQILEPGMVLTVEPGLYIAEEAIGIRIEDDVLVTEDGHDNLSKDIIRTTEAIEAFMAER